MVRFIFANCPLGQAFRVLLVGAAFVFGMIMPAIAQEAAFPMTEDYLSSGRVAEYIKDATSYLEGNRSSKFAPRVALDLLMIANSLSDSKLANEMKAFLLFEHPPSIQGSYVLSSFKDADDFSKFLVKEAEDRLKEGPSLLPGQFTQAIRSGLHHFKKDLLEDGPFLLKAYCIVNIEGDSQMAALLLSALQKEVTDDEDLAAILDICLDKELDTYEKVMQLHGKGDDGAFLEKLYLSRLSDPEKKRPEILKMRAENAIQSREYEEAQSLIASLPEKMRNDPQVLFWKGWTLFALRKDQEAIDTLGEIVQKHPGSEWAETALPYAARIRHFDERQKANANQILAISKVLREGIGVLEATVKYVDDSEPTKTRAYFIYLGMVPDENRLEVAIYKNDSLFVGYRTTAESSAIYLKSDPKTFIIKKSGLIPTPSLSLAPTDDGKFSFGAGLNMTSSMKQAGEKTARLFDSPYISTQEGIQALLDHTTRRQGWTHDEPITKNSITTFVWYRPATDSPTMKRLEYRVSASDIITYVKSDKVCVEKLMYATQKSFQLKPPTWPKRLTQESDELGPFMMMKLMGAVMELFTAK